METEPFVGAEVNDSLAESRELKLEKPSDETVEIVEEATEAELANPEYEILEDPKLFITSYRKLAVPASVGEKL